MQDMIMGDYNITFYSQNCNGLGDSVKRKAVFKRLKDKGEGIFLLQESHCTSKSEKLWDNEWGHRGNIYSNASSQSSGTCTFFSKNKPVNIIKKYTDCDGRYIIIDIELNDQIITIGNLYAPTRDKEKEQIRVFKSFQEKYDTFKRDSVILGGDFNLYLNPKLDKPDTMSDSNDNPHYRKEILSFLETEGLVDVWRVLNPDKRFYTWFRGKQKSRLDYFFISEHLLNVTSNVDILPGIQSDHSLLKLQINNSKQFRTGKGFWKFNSSLLQDTKYVNDIKEIIQTCGKNYEHLEDKSLVWEIIKMDIRNYTISYSISKKREQISFEKTLYKRYEELHDKVHSDNANEEEMKEYKNAKNEIDIIERHKAQGAILRSKCKWVEEGEKNTSYFLRLEKHNFCNKLISQIEVNNIIISEPSEILLEGKKYFKNLYSENNEPGNEAFHAAADPFVKSDNIPKISEEFKEMCDSDITETEILNSLKQLKNGKSPGTDGLTAEFYKFFWIDIKTYLIQSMQYSLKNGELSIDQRRGIIILIPKKDKNRLFFKNWRPITLLNVDYKLLAKTLAVRLCKVLPFIIDEDQTGYIKGRFIGCNIRKIEDTIIYTNINEMPGIILNIDFEKAFDSINWKFIDQCLAAFNFGTKFRSFVKTLYKNILSAVSNSGTISDWFQPERGVRQGCPLSPYLFILTVETLAINIRENKNIRGIEICGYEIKLCQLADDMSCFLKDIESVRETLLTFYEFEKCSGLKVNVEKTKAKFIGSYRNRTDSPLNLDWSDDNVYTLGVYLTGNEEDHYHLNFRNRILNMKNLLNIWKCRHLSLKGKITVINSLAISPLLYLASIIYVPSQVYKEVKKIIVDFLWDSKPAMIAYDVITQPISEGGLGLVDFELKCKALKIIWIKRLLSDNNERWKASAFAFYKTTNLKKFFNFNQSHKKLVSKFHENILNTWSDLQALKPEDLNENTIATQTIWNNRYITINKKPYIWDKWIKNGIVKIADIISKEGNIMNHMEINNHYNVNCNFLQALQLRQSIPSQWRSIISSKRHSVNVTNEVTIYSQGINIAVVSLMCKTVYNILLKSKVREPSCIKKWREDYPDFAIADSDIWTDIFKRAFHITRDTKLQSFQYKILHRLTPCNKRLQDINIKTEATCDYCSELDNIQHFFMLCPNISRFWDSFFQWWNRIADTQIPLDYADLEESILFGFRIDTDIFSVLNLCILIAKYFIHRERLFNANDMDFFKYLIELKFRINLEYMVCKRNNTLHKFEKYQFLYHNL